MSHKPTLAIDFDGVLALYDGWKGEEHLGEPHPDAPAMVRRYLEAGFQVTIFSVRAATREGRGRLKEWTKKLNLPDHLREAIETTALKPNAVVYLDDRALPFRGRFPDPTEITAFKTWSQDGGLTEDQASIGLWIRNTFPTKSRPRNRMRAIFEEAIELAFAEGMSPAEIADDLGAALTRCERQKDRSLPEEEAGDLYIALMAYGFEGGINIESAACRKMKKNRGRPQAYYDRKTREKEANGTREPEKQ